MRGFQSRGRPRAQANRAKRGSIEVLRTARRLVNEANRSDDYVCAIIA
jgi:hypothetical protein